VERLPSLMWRPLWTSSHFRSKAARVVCLLAKAVVCISRETQLRNCYAWRAHRARGGGQEGVVRMSRSVCTRVRAWRRQRWVSVAPEGVRESQSPGTAT
jgi:hypothetical protein